jgi:hypothetical protein
MLKQPNCYVLDQETEFNQDTYEVKHEDKLKLPKQSRAVGFLGLGQEVL